MKKDLTCDVVVAGGGIAGVSASVGAALYGAKVLLIERDAYLGGTGVHAGVGAFSGLYTCGDNPQKCVAGVYDLVQEEMDRLSPHSTQIIISATGNKNVQFKPEYLKVALDNLLDRFGVDYLLHTTMIKAVSKDDTITCIHCVDDEGEFVVHAKAFVDATGDANLAHLSGAGTVWGDEHGLVQTATLPFRLCGVDTSKDLSPQAVEKAVKKAKEAGIPNLTRERGFVQKMSGSQEVMVLLPSVIPNGLGAREMTHMEKFTRGQAIYYMEAFRRFLPGMEHCELTMIGPWIGLREGRRLVGRYVLTGDDVLNRLKRADGVARGGWKPEIHKELNEAAVYYDVAGASYYDIPLNALRSADKSNLYGCGRLISADSVAQAAVRVMGTCFATGHAAGVAAGLMALKSDESVESVRAELKKQAALV